MWLVQGPFTPEQPELISTKLLKPATQYPCGRKIPKDTPDSNKILLAGKAASRQTGTFIVGDVPDNLQADAVLSIKLPDKDKPRVLRNGADVDADTDDLVMLSGGDVIRKGITMKVINEIVYVYATPSINREVAKELADQAREFGVRVTRTWSHLTTHYLLDQIPEQEKDGVPTVYPIEMLCGLLNGSHFVTISWLKEFLAKAKLPRGSGNLEEEYNPPKAEDFKPAGPLSEPWQPSDSRQGLFKDINFIVLYDGSEPKKYIDKLINAGSGSMQTYSISSDKVADTPEKWSRYIRKARSKRGTGDIAASKLVLMGLESEVLKANEDWTRVFVEGAQEMDMRIVFEEDLALAILHADLAYIDCSLEHELPQSALHGNHHETSPSPAQFPTAKVVRSTLEEPTFDPDQPSSNSLSSRGKKTNSAPNPSAPKDEIEPSAAPLPPRRRPRLPTTRNALFGLEDDSIIEDEERASRDDAETASAAPEAAIPPSQLSGPSQSLPLAPPRRRGDTQSARNRMSIFGLEDEDDADNMPAEPISKRFRADFETNFVVGTLGDMEQDDMDVDVDADANTAPQSLRRSTRRSQSVLSDTVEPGPAGGTLRTSTLQSQSNGRRRVGSKSKRIMLSDVEEDSDGVEDAPAAHGQASKRRAVENVNSVAQASSRKTTDGKAPPAQPLATNQANAPSRDKHVPMPQPEPQKRGAAATGVDTAPEFLQALASKKKGKRKEDAFDREFNNLRITKSRHGAAPDLEQERAHAEEMEVWDEISKDMNITGNFMIVIETDDILRKDGGRREPAPLPDTGVPNFKRFKKKAPQNRPPPVELFVEPTVGYGEGSEYWEQDPTADRVVLNSQSQSQPVPRPRPRPRPRAAAPVARDSVSQSPPPAPTGARKRGTRATARHNVSSDDEVAFVPTQKAKTKSKGKGKAPTRKKDVPEYYPESEDPASEEEVVDRPPPRRTRGKPAVVAEDDVEDFGDAMAAIPDADDSVDDSTVRSSARNGGGRRTGTTNTSTRRSASVAPPPDRRQTKSGAGARKRGRAESDSDDGIAFKGFAVSKKRSKR